MKSLCLGTILLSLEVLLLMLSAQLDLREVSWEWVRSNTFLIFVITTKTICSLFTLKLQHRGMPPLFCLSTMCVTHPASCLTELLAPSGVGACLCLCWRGYSAMHPPHSSRNASGSHPVHSAAAFSLSLSLCEWNCNIMCWGKGGARPQTSFKTELWNQAGPMLFAISLSLFWRKLMSWKGRKEMLRA